MICEKRTSTQSPLGDSEERKQLKPRNPRLDKMGRREDDPERIKDRFWSKVNKDFPDKCWRWTAYISTNGYGQLAMKHLGKYVYAHRFSLEMKLGRSLNPGEFSCHHCDNRWCVNPDHLFCGSHLDNMRDSMSKGRAVHGDRVGTSKLKWDQVHEIRRLWKTGKMQKDLAVQFNVKNQAIWKIINMKSWNKL